MGYRSDVALCLKKEDFEILKVKSAELEYDIVESASTVRFDDKDNVVVISWTWIKWYEEFEEIALVNDFLDELDEQEKPYSFIRLGEESEDNEFKEGATWADGICNKIHMIRDIEIDI